MNRTIRLGQTCRLKIKPSAPFNFIATVFKPSHYKSAIVKFKDEKSYQILRVGRALFGIVLSDSSKSKEYPEVTVTVFARPGTKVEQATKEQITQEIRYRYNMDGDILEFLKSYGKDPQISGPIKRLYGMRPSCAYSLYEFLMITTMLQNTVVRRSVSMTEAMLNAFGKKVLFGGQTMYAFWTPQVIETVSEEHLRELRIGYRAKIVKRISESFAQGDINEAELRRMGKAEVENTLLGLYGVGPQSSSYLLSEYFHFYDAMDHLPPWEGKILSMLLFGDKVTPPEETLAFLTERYGSCRALAAHYLLEDVFWQRAEKTISWLEEEIRE